MTYSLTHADTLAVRNQPGIEQPLAAATTVTFDRSTLTLRPGGRARVEASFTADPNLPAGAVYGGYLVFTPDAGPALRVPYAGYKGDYQAVPALAPTAKGYPWLARRTGIAGQRRRHLRGLRARDAGSPLRRPRSRRAASPAKAATCPSCSSTSRTPPTG